MWKPESAIGVSYSDAPLLNRKPAPPLLVLVGTCGNVEADDLPGRAAAVADLAEPLGRGAGRVARGDRQDGDASVGHW